MLRINNRKCLVHTPLSSSSAAASKSRSCNLTSFIAGKVQMDSDCLKELEIAMQNFLKYSANTTSLIAGFIQFMYPIYCLF
jgi:hypothetical protein